MLEFSRFIILFFVAVIIAGILILRERAFSRIHPKQISSPEQIADKKRIRPLWGRLIIPCSFIFLSFIPLDIITCFIWLFGYIAFIYYVVRSIRSILSMYIERARAKSRDTLICSVVGMCIIILSQVLVNESMRYADQFAIRTGKDIQAQIDKTGKVPGTIENWVQSKSGETTTSYSYKGLTAKYPIRYVPNKDKFEILVHHNIDEGFWLQGGIGKRLCKEVYFDNSLHCIPVE
jgi:hypothetical protein